MNTAQYSDLLAVMREAEDLEELLSFVPSALRTRRRLVLRIASGFAYSSFGLYFSVAPIAEGFGVDTAFLLAGITFALLGLYLMADGIRGLVRVTKSPLKRFLTVVVRKRRERFIPDIMSRYLLILETERGTSMKCRVHPGLFEEVEKGDAGMAYVKGGHLLDLKPVGLPNA